MLAGTGKNTIRGLSIAQSGELSADYGNGDGTVPVESAVQGAAGTTDPLGEDVPIHYACGLGNTALAGRRAVTERSPRLPAPGGSDRAGRRAVRRRRLPGRLPHRGRRQRALPTDARRGPGRGGRDQDRSTAGLRRPQADRHRRADAGGVRVSAARYTLEVTPIGPDGAKGAPVAYGPLSGPATLAAGTELHVLQGGREVQPGTRRRRRRRLRPAGAAARPVRPACRPPPLAAAAAAHRPARLAGPLPRAAPRRQRRPARAAPRSPTRSAGPRGALQRRAARGRAPVGRPLPGRAPARGRPAARGSCALTGSFTHAGRAGRNTLRFSGRLARAVAPRRDATGWSRAPAGGVRAKHATFMIRRR